MKRLKAIMPTNRKRLSSHLARAALISLFALSSLVTPRETAAADYNWQALKEAVEETRTIPIKQPIEQMLARMNLRNKVVASYVTINGRQASDLIFRTEPGLLKGTFRHRSPERTLERALSNANRLKDFRTEGCFERAFQTSVRYSNTAEAEGWCGQFKEDDSYHAIAESIRAVYAAPNGTTCRAARVGSVTKRTRQVGDIVVGSHYLYDLEDGAPKSIACRNGLTGRFRLNATLICCPVGD